MKELVKIQVIPCDVIDPESIFVVQKVLRNLGVGNLPRVLFRSCIPKSRVTITNRTRIPASENKE